MMGDSRWRRLRTGCRGWPTKPSAAPRRRLARPSARGRSPLILAGRRRVLLAWGAKRASRAFRRLAGAARRPSTAARRRAELPSRSRRSAVDRAAGRRRAAPPPDRRSRRAARPQPRRPAERRPSAEQPPRSARPRRSRSRADQAKPTQTPEPIARRRGRCAASKARRAGWSGSAPSHRGARPSRAGGADRGSIRAAAAAGAGRRRSVARATARLYYRLQMGTTSQAHSAKSCASGCGSIGAKLRGRRPAGGKDARMSDSRSAYDDGQLPWLQAVDDEDEPRGVSARKMLAALLVVLLAARRSSPATFFWLGRREPVGDRRARADRAPQPGPYKVKPTDPGGLDVAGESETAFETSAGEDRDAQLDLDAVPETAGRQPPGAQAHCRRTRPREPLPRRAGARSPRRAAAAGSVIQLGAFAEPRAGRARLDRAVGALPERRGDEQAGRAVLAAASACAPRRASPADARRRCQALQGGGRELLRGAIRMRCRRRSTASPASS